MDTTWQGDTPHYDWRRYWEAWEDERAAVPATNYLPELDSEWERRYDDTLRTLDQLEHVPCLVLLGEPGIGKSTAVKAEAARLKQAGQRVVYHDLKEFADASDLTSSIFKSNSLADTTLFLDSLDEGLTVVERLATVLPRLIREAREDPTVAAGMHIRITCRSTEWPLSATNALRAIFPPNGLQVWHLCRLRRSDVEKAAGHPHWGIDGRAFSEEVDERRAVAFAAKPVTLNLLLQIKTAAGILPSRQEELYREGLTELCKDPNAWRREEGEAGVLPLERRFALARRIAVLSILGQKPFIERVVQMGQSPASLLTRRDIRGGAPREIDAGVTWEFSDTELDEVLGCGLFRGIGHNVTWAHQTYAEFLAADFLIERRLTDTQVEALILPPGDRDGRVAPQLHELASWLASIDERWRCRLMVRNADILLRSDVMAADAAGRLALAEYYLQAIDNKVIEEADRSLYPRLAMAGLGDVLRPYLTESPRWHLARMAAVDMAGQCRCTELVDDLISLALRNGEPTTLRNMAMTSLASIASREQLARLNSLLSDDSDYVRGQAVELLWPGVATTEEALPALRPPTGRVRSHYNRFIRRTLLERLPDADLPIALRWMTEIVNTYPEPQRDRERLWDFKDLCPRLYSHAVNRCHEPGVPDALADLVSAMVHHLNWLHPDSEGRTMLRTTPSDRTFRIDLVQRIIRRATDRRYLGVALIHHVPLLHEEDVAPLITILGEESDAEVRKVLARLIGGVLNREDENAMTQVWLARQDHAELEQATMFLFGPIPIEGEEAVLLRRQWVEDNRKSEAPPTRQIDSPDEVNRVAASYLDRVASGDAEGWWHMIRYLTQDQSNDLWKGWLDSRISSVWGWQFLEEAVRGRFIAGAVHYLVGGNPYVEDWWDQWTSVDWRALAGYRALEYLLEHAPDELEALPPSIWEKWAPALVRFTMNDEHEVGYGAQLVELCRANAGAALFHWLRQQLLSQVDGGYRGSIYSDLLKGTWDSDIGQLVAESLSRPAISPEAVAKGLELLFQHKHPFSHAMAEAAIAGRIRGEHRVTTLLAAIRHDSKKYWPPIWDRMICDDALARRIVRGAEREVIGPNNLPQDHLAEFYVMLNRMECEERALHGERESDVVRLDFIAGQIANFMVETASDETLAGLIRLRDAGFDWANHAIIRCRENKRRREWSPPSPGDVLALAASREKRMVASGAELLDLVMEGLGRFQQKIRDLPSYRERLWNTAPYYSPRTENQISDQIRDHLNDDLIGRGIVVNREVELRPSRGGEQGERTDIHIDAISRTDSRDKITVVIEAKGCWNDGLKTAMKTQLVDRYLTNSSVLHGIYLVGWFQSNVWENSKDSRRGKADTHGWDLEAGQRELEEQAKALSTDGREIRAFVLDARWPGDGLPPPKEARRASGKKKQ